MFTFFLVLKKNWDIIFIIHLTGAPLWNNDTQYSVGFDDSTNDLISHLWYDRMETNIPVKIIHNQYIVPVFIYGDWK